MNELFDIFSGGPEKDPMWLETVEGLSGARQRMAQLAAQKPGHYFLFSTTAQAILAEVETSRKPESVGRAHSAG